MSAGNERFNDEAADWDKNPSVQESSRLAFNALSPLITSLSAQKQIATGTKTGLHVLEVGCGTGLLTLRVAPLVASIVAIDPAQGMIETLKAKIDPPSSPSTSTCESDNLEADGPRSRSPKSNILPICHLLNDPEDPILPPEDEAPNSTVRRRKFDLIISHLVMHHVPDLRSFLSTLHGCLAPGGKVALTDFEDFGPEAIKFHPPSKLEGVERHGIQRESMEGLMGEVGFEDVRVQVRWSLRKSVEKWEGCRPGETMDFPFLLCEGLRPVA
ncbi:S-adenosyl-L-methionine-dependent methyltransferase [Aspergillus pseudodeflectus]|uniref:S-adenosyl-L-methionine-dependent methyltransferase n=1 Tax=Aspergillus pseudodeflectus TaxID=176178 RepID=A0ABR4K5Q2_9EURO